MAKVKIRRYARVITLRSGSAKTHTGLEGTMSALFLKDLAKKTKEGLRGRAIAGKSAGGLTFGYRLVRAFTANSRRMAERLPIKSSRARSRCAQRMARLRSGSGGNGTGTLRVMRSSVRSLRFSQPGRAWKAPLTSWLSPPAP